jgi:LmbE family N-acetylglucosaminyl deacetylase
MASISARSVGFDTSLLGTPLSCWDALECNPWRPQERALIVVAPHPDDETLGAGGLIHHYAQRQLRVTIVSVTDGEAACPEITDLAGVRHSELRAALGMLSAQHAEIIRLQIPDGRVEENRSSLADALRSVATADSLIVAPFERDGHPDHDAAGEIARHVADQQGLTLAAYPIWAWHQAAPESFSGRAIASLGLTPTARAAKANAVRCHASQLRERRGGPIVPPHVLAYFDRPYEAFLL